MLEYVKQNICVFGDSIVLGVGLNKSASWADLLKGYALQKNPATRVYLLGIDGDTSKDLLARFDCEAKARAPDMIIFAIGTNDSAYRGAKRVQNIPAEQFESNIKALIKKARAYTDALMFVGLAKGSDKETVPLPQSSTKKCYDKKTVRKYARIISSVCSSENLEFVPCFDNLDDSDFVDGLHPNEKGHSKIFELVKHKLRIS